MDLISLVIAMGAVILLVRFFEKRVKRPAKKEETKTKYYGEGNKFAYHSSKDGKMCPPHAWRNLYEDKYGLECELCKLRHP